ncbi:MAG: hypothetical protein ABSG46_10430 [Candidatus Binataceae bacterium]
MVLVIAARSTLGISACSKGLAAFIRTFLDTCAMLASATLYDGKTVLVAANLLNDRGIPLLMRIRSAEPLPAQRLLRRA